MHKQVNQHRTYQSLSLASLSRLRMHVSIHQDQHTLKLFRKYIIYYKKLFILFNNPVILPKRIG